MQVIVNKGLWRNASKIHIKAGFFPLSIFPPIASHFYFAWSLFSLLFLTLHGLEEVKIQIEKTVEI